MPTPQRVSRPLCFFTYSVSKLANTGNIKNGGDAYQYAEEGGYPWKRSAIVKTGLSAKAMP